MRANGLPFNTNEKDEHYKNDIYYRFNGSVYLVKHTTISRQYIGNGKTLKEALADAAKMVKENNLKVVYTIEGEKIKRRAKICQN